MPKTPNELAAEFYKAQHITPAVVVVMRNGEMVPIQAALELLNVSLPIGARLAINHVKAEANGDVL